jgi:hypothetical protein
MSQPLLSYTELRDQLRQAPMTWLPALLKTLIYQCLIKKPFREGALLSTIQTLIIKGGDPEELKAETHVE